MSEVIENCIGFASLRSVISLKVSYHLLNQSEAGADPGFPLGGGASLKNDVTDSWHKRMLLNTS